ncbi:MAG TPA: serine/threonine-protein kinase [Candidatus Acidoferrum sp.]|nr:serine/threonine-protein kinase [Candidatus Acidoferrum sp.]
MTPERWKQIKEVLEVALTLDVVERQNYLDRTCSGDDELRQEVDSLLAAHQPTGKNILDEPLANLISAGSSRSVTSGERIGAYAILQELGRGGMGEVYRAVRADGEFTKEVALKTVRGGYDVASVLERFRNERQILASLDHPNIARLLDGGTSETGIPYLVMELVDGIPIDTYCDSEKLNITARVELFLKVCAAVQYAHQRLVIHRDLKPGNILVTKEGMPKLLDFGIAKILDPTSVSDVTVVRPMTPEYASPEQIRGEPITTASDVYSLGVVLYQLLTGRSPYQLATRTPQDLSQAITDKEPERPSTAIVRQSKTQPGDAKQRTPQELSETRESSIGRLQKRLAGDLDNIVLQALRKEPQRRYASVEQLAEDLRRHLEGRPVSARQDSWSYRTGKFVQRHKIGVAATVLVALTLVLGVVVTAREAKIAEQNRLRAEKRFQDVRKLSNSLIFEIHDSIEGLPGATPARKLLLDRAVEYLDKLSAEAAGDPDLQRELAWGYQRLAVVQGNQTESNLGNQEAALASDGKALALFEAVAKANPNDTIDQLNVAMMNRILSFSELMEGGGREHLEKALAISDRLISREPQNPKIKSERSMEFQNLGILYQGIGDQPHLLEAFQKMDDLKQDLLLNHPDYHNVKRGNAMALAETADAMLQVGRRKEALALFDKALAGFEDAIKSGATPDVVREHAVAREKKAAAQMMDGDFSGAEEGLRLAKRVIEDMAKQDPENSMLQSDLIGVNYHLSVMQVLQAKYDEAAKTLAAELRDYQALPGTADLPPGKGPIRIWLGEAELRRRNYPQALEHFQEAVKALNGQPGKPMHDAYRCQLAESHARSGNALLLLGRYDEAKKEFQQALDIAAPSLAPQLQDVPAYFAAAEAQAGLGDVASDEANKAESAERRKQALESALNRYQASLDYWQRIPGLSRVSSIELPSEGPARAKAALARTKSSLRVE